MLGSLETEKGRLSEKIAFSIMNLEFGLTIAPSFTAGFGVCESSKGVLTSLSSAA